MPYQATLLKIDGNLVPLEQVSQEEKIRYQAGEVESITQQKHDGVKAVSYTHLPQKFQSILIVYRHAFIR